MRRYDKTVRIWDTATGAVLKTLDGHTGAVSSVAFSLDGALLASGSDDNTVRLWDTVTGMALKTLEGHTDCVISVAFSGNGALLASSSYDDTVRLWNAVMGSALRTIIVEFVLILSFSSDGTFLETDCGLLAVESVEDCYSLGISQPAPRTNICLNGNWVVRNSERLLWLPPEYRGNCSDIRSNILPLGHYDGRVTFMEFDSITYVVRGRERYLLGDPTP